MEGKIRKVAVVGTGTMGAQIAVQAAHFDYEVSAYDIDEGAFNRVLQNIRAFIKSSGRKTILPMEDWEKGADRVIISPGLGEALQGADLVIEAIPEDLALKRGVFEQIDSLAPQKAILATNSSSIPISRIEDVTSRPEKCLNLHFYLPTIVLNIVDVMGGTLTTPETIEVGKAWVRSIGCIPLAVKKEILGFCFNRVWRAVKRETLYMWAEDFVDFKDVDRAWMTFNGSPLGPFGMMDAVGLDVIYDIEMVYYNESKDPKDHPPEALKAMVDRKELGLKTGRGFYTYPDPEFRRPEFLKG